MPRASAYVWHALHSCQLPSCHSAVSLHASLTWTRCRYLSHVHESINRSMMKRDWHCPKLDGEEKNDSTSSSSMLREESLQAEQQELVTGGEKKKFTCPLLHTKTTLLWKPVTKIHPCELLYRTFMCSLNSFDTVWMQTDTGFIVIVDIQSCVAQTCTSLFEGYGYAPHLVVILLTHVN